MIKAVVLVIFAAVAAVIGAYAYNKGRSAVAPSAVVTAFSEAPDRLAGPRGAISYEVGFTVIEGTSRHGGLTFVQIQNRMGRFEVCGNYPVETRIRDYDYKERWLQTAVLSFKDIRLPASFIKMFVQGSVRGERIELDRTTVKCLQVEVPWHDRYYNMDARALSYSGPPLPAREPKK
ncbi:MAG: hypothetical protein JO055_12275 [Alphaproteobacteria bacterium]|nr:hypothetical protein [Alphaproteobacteria bacterium]